jgi:hypothetical protein
MRLFADYKNTQKNQKSQGSQNKHQDFKINEEAEAGSNGDGPEKAKGSTSSTSSTSVSEENIKIFEEEFCKPGRKENQEEEQEEDRESWGAYRGGPGQIGGFCVGPDGFIVGKKQKAKGMEYAMPTPVGLQGLIPIKLMKARNADEHTAVNHVTLYFIDQNEEKTVNIPQTALKDLKTGAGEAEKVCTKGFTIPAKVYEAELIADCVQKMYHDLCKTDSLETIYCDALPGWNVEGKHIRPGSECFIGDDNNMAMQQGSFKRWSSAIKFLLNKNPRLTAPFCFAVAGYLKGLVWDSNITPIFNMWGEGGTGKTTILQYVSSIQTRPNNEAGDSIIIQGGSTYVGYEMVLQNNNNGFVCFDELGTLAKEYDAISKLMKICNNGNRQKARGKIRRWNNTVVATANFSIVDRLPKNDEMQEALATRFCEICTDDKPILQTNYKPSKMQKILSALNNNCGTAYPRIIQMISENKDKYLKISRSYNDQIHTCLYEKEKDLFGNELHINKNTATVNRLIYYFAMCNVALHIFRKLLGLTLKDELTQKMTNGLFDVFNDMFRQYDLKNKDEELKDSLKHFFLSNIKNFEWQGPMPKNLCNNDEHNNNKTDKESKEDQLYNAKSHSAFVSRNQIWGRFITDEDLDYIEDENQIRGFLCVNQIGEREALKQGINIKDLANKAYWQGWLKYTVEAGKTRKKVKMKSNIRCYCFIVDFREEKTRQVEHELSLIGTAVEDIPF